MYNVIIQIEDMAHITTIARFVACRTSNALTATDYAHEVNTSHAPPMVRAAIEALTALSPGRRLNVVAYVTERELP